MQKCVDSISLQVYVCLGWWLVRGTIHGPYINCTIIFHMYVYGVRLPDQYPFLVKQKSEIYSRIWIRGYIIATNARVCPCLPFFQIQSLWPVSVSAQRGKCLQDRVWSDTPPELSSTSPRYRKWRAIEVFFIKKSVCVSSLLNGSSAEHTLALAQSTGIEREERNSPDEYTSTTTSTCHHSFILGLRPNLCMCLVRLNNLYFALPKLSHM